MHTENFIQLIQWFQFQPLHIQIIGIIIAVLTTICLFYLAIKLIEFVFRLIWEIIKFALYLTIIINYLWIAFCIIIPLQIITENMRIEDSWVEFKKTCKNITSFFYPGKKEEKVEPRTTINKQVNPIPSSSNQNTINYNKSQSFQTYYQYNLHVATKKTPIAFHCSNCGATFTPQMEQLLNKNKPAFCEFCGQGFKNEQNIPRPIEI